MQGGRCVYGQKGTAQVTPVSAIEKASLLAMQGKLDANSIIIINFISKKSINQLHYKYFYVERGATVSHTFYGNILAERPHNLSE